MTDNKGAIPISDLVHCHICPVRFYYERHGTLRESDRYAVCKQVSYHLGRTLDPDQIWQEILAVRPDIDMALRPFLDTCITACRKSSWQPAEQYDLIVRSQKYNIVGLVDRVGPDGNFSIIRCAGALPFGIYAADRLRLTGCAVCLQEMTGKEVMGGSVEYMPDGISRYHEIQPRDRRQFLSVLDKVRSIHDGDVPHPPLNAPCNRCSYRERCESTGGRKLSELL